MRYRIAFRRLVQTIEAVDEQAARDFAQYRWGITDDNVEDIQVRPLDPTTLMPDGTRRAFKGWNSADSMEDDPPTAA